MTEKNIDGEQHSAEAPVQNILPIHLQIEKYFKGLWSACMVGLMSGPGILYLVLTAGGVGWISYFLPTINGSEKSPETLGVYVIGLVISLFAEAMFEWKKGKADSLSETVMVCAVIFGLSAFLLSTKASVVDSHGSMQKDWHANAQLWLCFVLFLTILLWLALNPIQTKFKNPAIQQPASASSLG